MKFELERESKWNNLKDEMEVTYWIKIDGRFTDLSRTYEDAMKRWQILKDKYQPHTKEIIGVIEVDEEAIQPISETLLTEEVNGN